MVPPEDSSDSRRRFGRRSGRASGPGPQWPPAAAGSPVPGRLLTVEDRCWQCRSKVRAIIGVRVDATLTSDKNCLLPFDAVVSQLAAAGVARMLAARGIGELEIGERAGVQGGYLANG